MNNEFSLFFKKDPIYLSDGSLKMIPFKIRFKDLGLKKLI
jgi:hypothetical protein